MLNNNKGVIRTVGEGTLWMSGSGFFIKIIGIIYSVFVISRLSVYEYGLVELTLSILPMLGLLSLSGLQPVMVADLVSLHAEGKIKEMRNLFSSYFSLRLILSLISATGLFIATFVFSDYFHSNIIFLVQMTCIPLLIGGLRSSIQIACNVTHNFKNLSLFNFVGELIKLISVVILFEMISFGPLAVVLAYVISEVAIGFLFIPMIFRMREKMFDKKLFSTFLLKPLHVLKNHAKWSVMQGGVYYFGQNIRPWIIQFFLGTEAVGLYGVAMGMFQNVSSLFPLSRVIAPILPSYLADRVKLIKMINSAIKYQLVVLVLFSLMAIVFIPVLILTLFPDYMDAYPLFVLLTVTLVPGSFSRIFENVFHALKLQKDLFTSNLVLVGMTLIVLPASVYLFGLYGIALEFLLTASVYTIGRYNVLKKAVPSYLFEFKHLYKLTDTDKIIFLKIKQIFMRFVRT